MPQKETPTIVSRDPRFDSLSGTLNEGLFKESYSFVKEVREERINQLQGFIKEAKTSKDSDNLRRLRDMLGQEKDMANKGEQRKKDKEILKEVKQTNKDRAMKGLDPMFLKKRELKELRHKGQFEKLEKEGKLDEFMQKKQEEKDRRRVQR